MNSGNLGVLLDRVAFEEQSVGDSSARLQQLGERYREALGVISTSLWQAIEGGSGYLALSDLQTPERAGALVEELGSDGARHADWTETRWWAGRQLIPGDRPAPEGAGGLLTVYLQPPQAMEEEFNVWYNTEHIPYLGAVPGVLAARRFYNPGGRIRYLAVYHLAEPEVCASEAWLKAADTPWRRRMSPAAVARARVVYRRVQGAV